MVRLMATAKIHGLEGLFSYLYFGSWLWGLFINMRWNHGILYGIASRPM